MHIERDDIDTALVSRLVAAQFPQWAHLPFRPVAVSGWDNRTFHLGDDMSVRLPSAEGYAAQVAKEHRWLPQLAPHLPLPIPVPLAMGSPDREYPWPWSVYRWLDGEPATTERIDDLNEFATDLARFLAALQMVDPAGGPPAGPDNFHRGGSLATYDAETRQAITALASTIDTVPATEVWEAALAATWRGPAVWFHGDMAAGNLLVDQGQLSAVIDFGCSGVGDAACDLAIAWTLLDAESREAFRRTLAVDSATWARGRGWTLWKGLITLAGLPNASHVEAGKVRQIIGEVLGDHERTA